MKKIILIQFRTSEKAANAEQDDIAQVLGDIAVIDTINTMYSQVDWRNPKQILDGYDGVILGGSGDIHFDGGARRGDRAHDLMYATAEAIRPFLRYILQNDIPTLGICLGHQLLAYVAGADVKTCQRQSKVGTFPVKKCCPSSDPVFGTLPETFDAQYGHKDSVSALPRGAMILAQGQRCDYSALRYGRNIYTTQFHPELDRAAMAQRLAAHPEYLPDGATANDLFSESPYAQEVLRNFARAIA